MEKHLQSILSALTLAGILWMGNTLLDVKDRMARLEEKVIALAGQVGALTARVDRLEEDNRGDQRGFR